MAPHEIVESLDRMDDEQLEQHALEILRRELGLYGFARFLHTFRKGSGDYTAERHQWLDALSIAQVTGDEG